jgi:hypothetical protein
VRLALRSRRRALTNSSPLSGFRTGESGAYGGEGGRMIAAISIGIIIIVAVIIAAQGRRVSADWRPRPSWSKDLSSLRHSDRYP